MKHRDLSFRVFSNAFLILMSLACLLPFILMIMASFSDDATLATSGYAFIPDKLSLNAYKYLFRQSATILRAYAVTIGITVVGTVLGLFITTLLAYPLSRSDLPFGRALMFYVFFTMLFNGGLVPTYLIYVQWFHIKNTFTSLIVPGLLMNAVNVLLMRTNFKTSIPVSVLESASIDGASEYTVFFRIVLPLSLPILATIGLLIGISYWNDWFNGMIYVTDAKLFSLQNYLTRVFQNIQYLAMNAGSQGSLADRASLPTSTARMAIAAIGSLPVLIIYPFFQKYFAKGIMLGAVKG